MVVKHIKKAEKIEKAERIEKSKEASMLLKDDKELFNKIDIKKNIENGIDINTITTGSMKKVWWKCDNCYAHSYDMRISHKKRYPNSCPICSGQRIYVGFNDLLTTNKELIENEWNYSKNNVFNIYPTNFTRGSGKKAWWKCQNGHEWEAVIASRTGDYKRGCPICSHNIIQDGINDLATKQIELLKEWDYEKNNELGIYPNKIAPHTTKKVWWICPQCGNSYLASPSCRISGTACPKCANEMTSSFPEQAIYFYLKQLYDDAKSRAKIDRKEVDIYIPSINVGIEYDGIRFHKGRKSIEKEVDKYNTLSKKSIYLIRIKEKGLETQEKVADSTIYIKPQHNDNQLTECIKELILLINKITNVENNTDLIDVSRDRITIYQNYIQTKKENSIESLKPELVKEWNYNKNGSLKPSMFSVSSEKKVWWRCDKGHEWEAYISNRASKNVGCPYCAGKKVMKGFNDLETLYPEIAKEWNYEKNGDLKPYELTYGSEKKVWWKCPKGHEYISTPNHRTASKNGCPYCASQKIIEGYNDLKTKCPEILTEWNYEKNDKLGIYPNQVGTGYGKKVWWKCKNGHEWQAMINIRVGQKHAGCPECAGRVVIKGNNDLESQYPELLLDWDYDSNELTPSEIHINSQRRMNWKCHKCGHEWNTKVYVRTKMKCGCPKCNRKGRGLKK